MGRIILEIHHNIGNRREYLTFWKSSVSIGRGFDNDVILNDPYVSPRHCVLRQAEDGTWVIEDLHSANGTRINGEQRVEGPFAIPSGEDIVVGRTRLRMLLPDHPVAATRLLSENRRLFHALGHPFVAVTLLVTCVALMLCEHFLQNYEVASTDKYFSFGLILTVMILVWAGGWAFVGRLIRHRTGFFSQLSLSSLFLPIMVLLQRLIDVSGYNLSSLVTHMLMSIVSWLFLFVIFLSCHLAVATYVTRRLRIIVGLSLAMFFLAIVGLQAWENRTEFNPVAEYYVNLEPPFLKFAPAVSIDTFLQDSQTLF